LAKGDSVSLATPGGSLTLPVKIDYRLPENVVRVPRNLAGAPAEQLLAGNRVAIAVEIVKASVQEPA
jgi:hypothetical protein